MFDFVITLLWTIFIAAMYSIGSRWIGLALCVCVVYGMVDGSLCATWQETAYSVAFLGVSLVVIVVTTPWLYRAVVDLRAKLRRSDFPTARVV
jgi:hypothetical protein